VWKRDHDKTGALSCSAAPMLSLHSVLRLQMCINLVEMMICKKMHRDHDRVARVQASGRQLNSCRSVQRGRGGDQ